MKKLTYTKNENNLLINKGFISKILLEAELASALKGGHSPFYQSKIQNERTVSKVNLLNSKEKLDVATSYFIGEN